MKEPTLQTRREFLRKGITVAAVTMTVPSFLSRTAYALNDPADVRPVSRSSDEPILVVLQLAGGNDGLNTIVPYADDAYYRVRPQLAIPRDQALKINDHVGMNPELAGLKSLYDDGHVAIVQGVGYPNPDRSHFRSMEIWETASGSERFEKYGWIGRYFDNTCMSPFENSARGPRPATSGAVKERGEAQPVAGFASSRDAGPVAHGRPKPVGTSPTGSRGQPEPTLAVSIGGKEPLTFHNPRSIGVSLESPESFQWNPGGGMAGGADEKRKLFADLNRPVPQAPSALDFLQRTALNAQVSSARIREAVGRYHTTVEYPPVSPLAQGLRLIAAMIAGGLGTRVYYASLGGFDTHAGQRPVHTTLMTQLAASVRAFYEDLRAQGNADCVLVMTFSEFGRRVAENASGGTDHGTAAPMFLFGSMVRPGLYGEHPSLTDLDQGDLKFKVDFRSVYATVLEKWLKTDPRPILSGSYPTLPFL